MEFNDSLVYLNKQTGKQSQDNPTESNLLGFAEWGAFLDWKGETWVGSTLCHPCVLWPEEGIFSPWTSVFSWWKPREQHEILKNCDIPPFCSLIVLWLHWGWIASTLSEDKSFSPVFTALYILWLSKRFSTGTDTSLALFWHLIMSLFNKESEGLGLREL